MTTGDKRAKHTPGPWKVFTQSGNWNGLYQVWDENEMEIKSEHEEANAALIAATPELLEACIAILPYLTSSVAADKVMNAIAKAEGRA